MKMLLNLCKNKRIAFLENAPWLQEEQEILGVYLFKQNIDFVSICSVEKQGLRSVLGQCRDMDLIIFQTTFVYPVSRQLREAFMSIKNEELKKTFIEIYVYEPKFKFVPDNVIHDIYMLCIDGNEASGWDLQKLERRE